MGAVSLEQVYQEYYEKVRGLVYKKVGDSAVVEDIVSDIFLKIARNLDRFDESKASLGTWVYTVSNRYILDYYRTRKIYAEIPDDSGAEGILPDSLIDSSELDADILMEEQLEELADALETLKQKERDLVILYYYKNITLKEVAEVMGMSYANAKVIHKKALTRLNEMLSKD